MPLLSLFYRGHWGTERLRNFPKVTELWRAELVYKSRDWDSSINTFNQPRILLLNRHVWFLNSWGLLCDWGCRWGNLGKWWAFLGGKSTNGNNKIIVSFYFLPWPPRRKNKEKQQQQKPVPTKETILVPWLVFLDWVSLGSLVGFLGFHSLNSMRRVGLF